MECFNLFSFYKNNGRLFFKSNILIACLHITVPTSTVFYLLLFLFLVFKLFSTRACCDCFAAMFFYCSVLVKFTSVFHQHGAVVSSSNCFVCLHVLISITLFDILRFIYVTVNLAYRGDSMMLIYIMLFNMILQCMMLYISLLIRYRTSTTLIDEKNIKFYYSVV